MAQLAARRAHDPEVLGSNPSVALDPTFFFCSFALLSVSSCSRHFGLFISFDVGKFGEIVGFKYFLSSFSYFLLFFNGSEEGHEFLGTERLSELCPVHPFFECV